MSGFKKGQTVYDRSGRVYEFTGMMDGAAIVRPMLEGEDYDGNSSLYASELAEVRPVAHLCDKPPVQFINADVSLATQKLADLNAAIAEASAELKNAEKVNAARLEKLKRYDALSRIEDFIDGKMTHFAIRSQYGRSVEVKTFDEVMQCKDDYGRFQGDIKLLSLFGTRKNYPEHANKDGNLLWRVNQYYDGSGGGWHIVQPCLSEDEAREAAAGWLDGFWDEHRGLSDRETRAHWLSESIKSAEALGFEVPADIMADFNAHRERAAKAAVEKAKAELEKAMQAAGGAT